MRKLKNKKGFTLVELMIVVVILGILVAIAVPIYNINVRRAKEKACRSNMKIIQKAGTQFLMTYDGVTISGVFPDGTGNIVTVSSAEEAKEKFTAEFLAMFDENTFPVTENETYTIRINDDKTNIVVTCSNEEHN